MANSENPDVRNGINYNDWMKNPALSYEAVRHPVSNPIYLTPDDEAYQSRLAASKALYDDISSPLGQSYKKAGNIPTLEAWQATNPLIKEDPYRDYLSQFYNIPQSGLDAFGTYAPFIAMAAMGGAAGGMS